MLDKKDYLDKRKTHWERVYNERDPETGLGKSYRRDLCRIYRFLIGKGSSVLEIGCGRGDLLAAIAPESARRPAATFRANAGPVWRARRRPDAAPARAGSATGQRHLVPGRSSEGGWPAPCPGAGCPLEMGRP